MKMKKNTEIGQIPSGWNVRKLGDLLYIKGRIGWKGLKKAEFGKDGIIIINGPQINEGKVNLESCLRVPKWRYEESPDISVKEKDILMTKDGTIGKMAYIDELSEAATLASGIFLIRTLDPHILDQMFLYQYLNSNFFKKLVNSRIEGSVVPHLYQRDIEELLIPLPSIEEQKRIANIPLYLGSKIELNQRMNKTLETIAQAIFKHWFIDFEFPDENGNPYKSSGGEMVDSEIGEIPSKWSIKALDNVADFLNGLPLQKFPSRDDEESLPVIKIREMKNGITDSTDRANLKVPSEYLVHDGDILFSWSGSLGIEIWGKGEGALNQHLFKVTSNNYPKWFFYHWLLLFLPRYIGIAKDKSTTMGHIQRYHISESLVSVPDEKTFSFMSEVMNPIVEKLVSLKVETKMLSTIRDSLLPKLMSGKIRVPLGDTDE